MITLCASRTIRLPCLIIASRPTPIRLVLEPTGITTTASVPLGRALRGFLRAAGRGLPQVTGSVAVAYVPAEFGVSIVGFGQRPVLRINAEVDVAFDVNDLRCITRVPRSPHRTALPPALARLRTR